MFESRKLEKRRTLQLQDDYVDHTQRWQRRAKAWGPSWWRERRQRGPLQRADALARVLAQRYEGVMLELMDRCGVPKPSSTDRLDVVWSNASVRVLTVSRAEGVPDPHYPLAPVLWDSVISALGCAPSPLSPLRPKFMLRQFVEEMPSSEPRGTLLSWAFERHEGSDRLSPREVVQIKEAYALLHQQVEASRYQLEWLTGDELKTQMLDGLRQSFAQYHAWLMDS